MINIYSFFDKKSNSYLTPTFSVSDGVLIRDLRVFLRKPGNMFAQFPEDYELRKIGVFFEDEGHIDSFVPYTVISFVDILKLDDESEVYDGNGDSVLPD